jgi:hypothetical protein
MPSRHAKDTRGFVKGIARLFFNRNLSDETYKAYLKNGLIAKESAIGAEVFGLKNTEYERNEFFFEGRDKNGVDSWFFHQEKTDPTSGNRTSRTLHYEILPAGVLLVGRGYLSGEELNKFIVATKMYHERVMKQIYSGDESTNYSQRSNQRLGKIGKVIHIIFGKNDGDSNKQAA